MTRKTFSAAAIALCLCAPGARAGDKAAALQRLDAARGLFVQGQFREALRSVNEALTDDSKN